MLVLHDFVGKVGSIAPFTALRKVSMYSMSRYWVAAVITVRVRILLSFRLDEHCWNAALLFVLVVRHSGNA